MKRIIGILTVLFFSANYTNALIVSVEGHGEISEKGMSIDLLDGKQDPLTGKYVMSLSGQLQTSSPSLSVTINRSQAGLSDEFCCGDNCLAGNGQEQETDHFSVNGLTSWFIHYTPEPGAETTIQYIFSDGTDSRTLQVHYVAPTQDIPLVTPSDASAAVYTLGGALISTAGRSAELPSGLYIHGNKLIYKIK